MSAPPTAMPMVLAHLAASRIVLGGYCRSNSANCSNCACVLNRLAPNNRRNSLAVSDNFGAAGLSRLSGGCSSGGGSSGGGKIYMSSGGKSSGSGLSGKRSFGGRNISKTPRGTTGLGGSDAEGASLALASDALFVFFAVVSVVLFVVFFDSFK